MQQILNDSCLNIKLGVKETFQIEVTQCTDNEVVSQTIIKQFMLINNSQLLYHGPF